ncbi:hypothetical protein L6164_024377 [Bauhinia variegata]|uniref:Uncharacterized protein n=1 Tax=Bauhinia variegata TaxID=167791 RepID=A0ACB9LX98_BAUVA|nr:hypothetical protein L6164_024377 [Bauhinia variegata]
MRSHTIHFIIYVFSIQIEKTAIDLSFGSLIVWYQGYFSQAQKLDWQEEPLWRLASVSFEAPMFQRRGGKKVMLSGHGERKNTFLHGNVRERISKVSVSVCIRGFAERINREYKIY